MCSLTVFKQLGLGLNQWVAIHAIDPLSLLFFKVAKTFGNLQNGRQKKGQFVQYYLEAWNNENGFSTIATEFCDISTHDISRLYNRTTIVKETNCKENV